MQRYLYGFLFLIFLSCNTGTTSKKVDVSTIPISLALERFEQKFYTCPPSNLNGLKEEFPRFFPNDVPDSIWLSRMTDKEELRLFDEINTIYPNFTKESEELKDLFKHIVYYFPSFKVPKVTTLLTMNPKNKVVYTGEDLLLSLESYLGRENEIYQGSGFPNYLLYNLDASHLMVDVAENIVEAKVPNKRYRTFLDKMISEGKKRYIMHLFLPEVSEQELFGYLPEKYQWIQDNEVIVWKYFFEKDLLYSTDSSLLKRFIDNAPFSKFYFSEDNNTPGRVGVYIGYKIVSKFMQHNNISVRALIDTSPEDIFSKAKYKPKR